MELCGLDWHAWFTLLMILGLFTTMLKTKLPADIVFLSVVGLLLLAGCLPADVVLSGFSNTSVVVMGVLFVVVAGLEATGVLQWIAKYLMGQPRSYNFAVVRLMLPVAILSAFLSNATVVALFTKVVKIWSRKLNIAPSKLLIPLAYAASLGGVCTLIGTPPNLIISNFYHEHAGKEIGIFITTLPGLFCLCIGMITIILLQRLIPTRISPEEKLAGKRRKSTTELKITNSSHLVGQTLADIRMDELCKDSNLMGIIRFDGETETVGDKDDLDSHFIMGGDTLVFTGNRNEILEIGKRLGMECELLDKEPEMNQGYKTAISSLILIGMAMLSAFNIMPLLNSCVLAALLMMLTRCCSIKQARMTISWEVLMVFASSVVLGKAIDATGMAELVASQIENLAGPNPLVALIVICSMGTFLTELVSNTACGAILAPIALNIATNMGVNPLTFCVGLMVSVSCSFATPIGTAPNLMVYVPGGYRFSDFMRIGLPMNFIILAANITITLLLFPL